MGSEASKSTSVGEVIPNDVHIEWKKIATTFGWPAAEGQVGCAVDGALFVFGGVNGIGETNDLLRFDIEGETWTKVPARGELPEPRVAASLVAVGRQLYLWGGLNSVMGWPEGMHVFDIDAGKWSKVSVEGSKPRPRDKFQAVAMGTKIYYFGGFGPAPSLDEDWDEEDDDDDDDEDQENHQEEETEEVEGASFTWFNDLWVFDTATKAWSQPMQMNLGVPAPRAAHSMCAVGNDLVIFGGRTSESRQNDIHIFNTETRKWRLDMEIKGQMPAPRSFHAAVSVGSRLVVLGGRGTDNQSLADIHVFDTERCQWLQPAVSGELPCGRDQHVAMVVGDQVLVFGGTKDFVMEMNCCQTLLNDIYKASTEDFSQGGAKQTNGHAES